MTKLWLLATLVATALPACATDDEPADDWADADPSDFDTKADGISGSSQAVLDLIDRATERVFVQIPTLTDKTLLTHLKAAATRGSCGRSPRSARSRTQHRGVAVRVMLEPRTVGFANEKQVAKRLAAAGIAVTETPPAFDSSHNVDHAKFMVIDGKELVFGSGNLVRSGLGGNLATEFTNRDFWIRDHRAASAAEAVQLFAADWARTATTSIAFKQLVLTPDNADARILALIDGATTRLDVYNQSLNDATLQRHLKDAAHRGVKVRVLLGMQPGFGGAPPGSQPAIDDLATAGITAGFFTAHYLHGKVVIADGKAFVGSENFTTGGLVNNRELGEIFASTALVTALENTFAADLAHPAP